MKSRKIILLLFGLLCASLGFAQTVPTNTKALRFITQGIDTAAIKAGAYEGTMFYNPVSHKLRLLKNSTWVTVGEGTGGGGGAVSDFNGRIGSITPQSGDYTFSQIGSKPTTILGYGITDPIVFTSGSYSNPSWLTALAWSKLTGTPTTISGYGITDAVPSTRTINSQPLSADISLTKSNIGLSNVDNTSDVNKPVSTAQQTAIDGKVADAINDAVTTIAPSQNATFDALATKQALPSSAVKTADYTPTTTVDANQTIEFNPTADVNFTLPPNGSVAYPNSTFINISTSLHKVTVVPGSGVSITSTSGTLTTPGDGTAPSVMTLVKSGTGTNSWFLYNGIPGSTIAAAGTLTGTTLATNVVSSSLTSTGTMTSGKISTGYKIGGVTMELGSDASYDTYYRNSSGVLVRMPNGTTGQVFTATTGAAPSWAAVSGTGYYEKKASIVYGTASLANGSTYYFGAPTPTSPTTAADNHRVYVQKTGTLTVGQFAWYTASTAGTGESISLYVRVNNTTDYLIATISTTAARKDFSNTSMSISLTAGDYYELKLVCPTWSTPPTSVQLEGYVAITF